MIPDAKRVLLQPFVAKYIEHRDADLEGTHNTLSLQAVWAMGPHKHETY